MTSSQESNVTEKPVSKSKTMQLQRLEKAGRSAKPKKSEPKPASPQKSAASVSDINPSNTEPKPEGVQVEIDSHEKESSTFSLSDTLKKAGRRLKENLSADDSLGPKPKGKKAAPANEEDFYTLLVAGFAVVISFSKVPKEVRPNDEELTIFSKHLGAIMIRHFPQVNALSPDVMDVVGMVVIANTYYARVAEDLKRYQAPKIIEGKATPPRGQEPTQQQAATPTDDISRRAPGVASFLDAAEHRGGVGVVNE